MCVEGVLYLLVNGCVAWCVYLLYYEPAASSNTNKTLLARRLIIGSRLAG